MKITRIFAHRVELPLHEGSYKWSGGKSVSVFDSTIVGVETDSGLFGYGEVCPLGPFGRELPGRGLHPVSIAFEKVKSSGLYDRVEQRFGDGRSANVRAYAITNQQEYFAECTEAFFSTNDFFPFSREQLEKHDPECSLS